MNKPVRSMMLALATVIFVGYVSPSLAHRLNVFAAFDGTRIVGEAYFTGGSAAENVEVQARNVAGDVVAATTTDLKGRFAFEPIAPADIEVVVDARDGHVARFRIDSTEMGGPATSSGEKKKTSVSPVASSPENATLSEFRQVVDRVVARRLEPLRRQIAEYESKVRLHDVLGGIGYLVGIAGLAFWWLARREAKGRDR